MKFHLATSSGNIVTGHGSGWVRVGTQEYRENVVLTPDSIATGWGAAGFDALTDADFAALLATKPDVVIFGTGSAIRFPLPALTRALAAAQVGLEVMDTAAACRTFNILSAEGRRVTAALIVA